MTLGWQCRIEKSGGILCVRSRLRSKDDDDDNDDNIYPNAIKYDFLSLLNRALIKIIFVLTTVVHPKQIGEYPQNESEKLTKKAYCTDRESL